MTTATLLARYESLMSDPTAGTLELYDLQAELVAAAATWRTPASVARKLYAREREVRARLWNRDAVRRADSHLNRRGFAGGAL